MSEDRKNIDWETNQNKSTSVISYLWRACIFRFVESEKWNRIMECSAIQVSMHPPMLKKCFIKWGLSLSDNLVVYQDFCFVGVDIATHSTGCVTFFLLVPYIYVCLILRGCAHN